MLCMTQAPRTPDTASGSPGWTFLTNHSHVLICIAQQPDVRLSEVARLVGIGERAVHRIVHELEDAGYLTVTKEGRRNIYEIDLDRPLRHPLESHQHIRAVVAPLLQTKPSTTEQAH
jgi:DNA-binding IclR family transcriptional regulator